MSQYRFARIVTCDPHSFHVLKNEYADLSTADMPSRYEVFHHSTYINQLVTDGKLNVQSLERRQRDLSRPLLPGPL